MDDLDKVLEEIAKIIAGGMGWDIIKTHLPAQWQNVRTIIRVTRGQIVKYHFNPKKKIVSIEELEEDSEKERIKVPSKHIVAELGYPKSVLIIDGSIYPSLIGNAFNSLISKHETYYKIRLMYSKSPDSFLEKYSILISIPQENNFRYECIINTQINHNRKLYFKIKSEVSDFNSADFETFLLKESRLFKPLRVSITWQEGKLSLTTKMDGKVLNEINFLKIQKK